MKKRLLLALMAFVSLINVTAQVPVTSTVGNEIWYHIKCSPRNTATAMWLTGAPTGQDLTVADFSTADAQLWKVVPNKTGIALVNKAYGNYLNSDLVDLKTTPLVVLNSVDAPPATALKFVTTPTIPGAFNGVYGVDIVDVGTKVDEFGTIDQTSIKFSFYSAGSGSNFKPIAYARGEGTILVHSAALFLTDKDMQVGDPFLKAFYQAKWTYTTCNVGTLPGQYKDEDRAGFKDIVDSYQAVLDGPVLSAAEYQTNADQLNAMYAEFKKSVIMPQVSTATEDYWYFLQGTRPTGTYLTSTGAGANIKDNAIVPDDTQLWKFVPNTNGSADGFAIQNKATGEYLNADISGVLNTKSEMPATNLRFIVSPEASNRTMRFWIENTGTESSAATFRLHAGGSGHSFQALNWTGGANDNCTWMILDYAASQRVLLGSLISNCTSVANALKAGTAPGLYSAAAIDEYKAAIAAAKLVYDDLEKTSDEYITALRTLTTVKDGFKAKVNLPVISTDASSTWYILKGKRPTATPVMAASTLSDSTTYQIVKFNNEEQWRFVANGDGFALQNKATNRYLNADEADNAELKTVEAMPTKALKFVVSEEKTGDAVRFWIENTGTEVSFRLHAGQTVPYNYTYDANDNCTWLIEDYKTTTNTAFNDRKTLVSNIFNNTAQGTGFGQYPEASRNELNKVVAEAAAVDLNTIAIADLGAIYNKLAEAIETYKIARVSDVTTITSTKENPKWYFVTGCNYLGAAGFNTRLAKSDTNVKGVTKNDNSTDQMWRFELNTGDNTVRMINKTAGEEIVIAGQSVIGTMGAEATGTSFTLDVHGDGYSSKITYPGELMHCDGSKQIVGWSDNNNPNSAWRIDEVPVGAGVKNVTTSKFLVRSNSGVITVVGVAKFELYTVMGQKCDPKAVQRKGVYVVKVGNETQKYILK